MYILMELQFKEDFTHVVEIINYETDLLTCIDYFNRYTTSANPYGILSNENCIWYYRGDTKESFGFRPFALDTMDSISVGKIRHFCAKNDILGRFV